MKLVYFGTAEFAVPTLERLAAHVQLVVTQPDRASGRGLRLQPSPVKRVAQDLDIDVWEPESCRASEFIDLVETLGADALLVAAYGQILPQRLLAAARQGAFNLHGSVLPNLRGAAPIQRSVLQGLTETGVTLIQMDRGMDSGDIVAVQRTPIGPDETYGELASRLAEIAAKMAQEWMPRIVAGDFSRTAQRHDEATYAPKIERSETEMSFFRSAEEEYRRQRAFTPSPGARLITVAGPLKIARARFAQGSGTPGEVLQVSPELAVAFQTGALQLSQVQPSGRPSMSGREYANGQRLRPGSMLAGGNTLEA